MKKFVGTLNVITVLVLVSFFVFFILSAEDWGFSVLRAIGISFFTMFLIVGNMFSFVEHLKSDNEKEK